MRILATQYSLPTKSLEIYVSGCAGKPHCKNCHNPESWDFNAGEEYSIKYFSTRIAPKILEFPDLVKNVYVLGGEPLDQDHLHLTRLLLDLKSLKVSVWLFTRYDFDQLPKGLLRLVDYVKCGRYEEELKVENNVQYGIRLATSNQIIYKKGVNYK